MNKKVYIIILNYQTYDDTIKYVKCLEKQIDIEINILIVDNCSPNGSFEILKNELKDHHNVEVIISEKNGGYAYGNNFGLNHIKNKDIDYILISNNDIFIDDIKLISKMIYEYEKINDVAFISPVMYVNGEKSDFPAWRIPTLMDDIIGSLRIFEILFKNVRQYKIKANKELIVDCLPGSFFLGKKNIFFDLGLFDENTFLYMEEAIWAYKVKINNYNNYLIPKLKYEHMNSKTISSELSMLRMRKYLIDSRIYFHRKYLKTNFLGILTLKFLFQIWKIENFLLYKFIKKENK